jgi:hypothetical protein
MVKLMKKLEKLHESQLICRFGPLNIAFLFHFRKMHYEIYLVLSGVQLGFAHVRILHRKQIKNRKYISAHSAVYVETEFIR